MYEMIFQQPERILEQCLLNHKNTSSAPTLFQELNQGLRAPSYRNQSLRLQGAPHWKNVTHSLQIVVLIWVMRVYFPSFQPD